MRLAWVHQTRMEDVIAMKKITCVMMAVAALAMIPSASWALPVVELAPDCSYAADIDLWGGIAVPALDLGVYDTVDMDADGVPDAFQFGLLAAVLCAGDTTVLGQWTDNSDAINDYLATFATFLSLEPSTGAAFAAVAPQIASFYATYGPDGANVIPAPALPAFALLLQGNPGLGAPKLADLAALLDGGQEIVVGLPAFVPYLAAQLGISTESNAALQTVWSAFFGLFPTIGGAMVAFYEGALDGVAAVAAGAGQTALATAAAAAADLSHNCGLSLAVLSGTLPTMAIYGVSGKAAGEPFSGLGDYNDNGDLNVGVYNGVVRDGGDRAEFVARASGAELFYVGSPAVPVAGILGLALLAGACVMGGAASIRRK